MKNICSAESPIGLLKNTVRAEPFETAQDKLRGASHGVEAAKLLIGSPYMFRLRYAQPVLSDVEGLSRNGA